MTGIRLSGLAIPTVRDQPWRERAKCLGQDWREYVVEDMPKGRNAPETRAILAQAKCSGCPVRKQCAEDALDNHDRGVIRAGVPIPASDGTEEYRHARRALERTAGRPHTPTKRKGRWPKTCGVCHRSMRPRGSYLDEFPDTVIYGGADRCGPCQVAEWRNNNGGREKNNGQRKAPSEGRSGGVPALGEHPAVRRPGAREDQHAAG